MKQKNYLLTILSIFLFCGTAFAGVTSLDNVFVANDQYASDFYSKLNRNFSQLLTGGINNIEGANIKNDSLLEANFADEINPRIRFYEQGGSGTECEMVYTGFIPATSASLTTDTSAGTAYVRGYRISRASATTKSYTASKWTYVDVDASGDFHYTEVAIGAAAPSIYTNSIRLARVSSDATTVNTVSDLRTTSCTTATFVGTKGSSTEASLSDILINGQPVRKTFANNTQTTPNGYAQGAFATWDTHTTFKVSSGGLYINGKYRANSTTTTVTTGADDPANGVSGITSGAVGASTAYNIYAVADQDATKTFSVSFGTGATGLTNYRLIGSIKTDATNLFTSADVYVAHAIMPNEIQAIRGWVSFNGSSMAINASYNLSSITDNGGTGDYTLNWTSPFSSANYAVAGTVNAANNGANEYFIGTRTKAAGTTQIYTAQGGGTLVDQTMVDVMVIGN